MNRCRHMFAEHRTAKNPMRQSVVKVREWRHIPEVRFCAGLVHGRPPLVYDAHSIRFTAPTCHQYITGRGGPYPTKYLWLTLT